MTRSPSLAFALALALAPTATLAQPALERARERFEAGQRALDEGRYADAARAFEQSLAVAQRPGTLFNLGLAYRSLGRCTEAIQSLEDFASLSHDEERVATARAVLADLRGCPATVNLSLGGEPTEVLVDGQRRPLRAGRQSLRLDPGRHVIEARRPGYAPARAEVDLDRGGESSVSLDASSTPYDGWLRLDLEGSPAVRVDGEAWSSGDAERLVPAGRHEVEVRYGGDVQRRSVEVPPGGRATLGFSAPSGGGVASRWWFWAVVGVAAAGAVTAVVVTTTGGDSGPSDNLWTRVRVGP